MTRYNSGGISDHGELDGLTDNDHTQYVLGAGAAVSDLQSIANAADLDFQPAAGVECILTFVVMAQNSNSWARFTDDGTNEALYLTGELFKGKPRLRIPVDNSVYFRINNNSGGAMVVGYSGYTVTAGTVVVGFANVANGANMEYQPASGVEVRIVHMSGQKDVNAWIKAYNGSIESKIESASDLKTGDLDMFIDNTNYVRLENSTGSGINMEIGRAHV